MKKNSKRGIIYNILNNSYSDKNGDQTSITYDAASS